jgi:hypothetical protein
MADDGTSGKKKGMPRGMYIGSAWIGFAIFMLLCWILSFITVNSYVRQGVGDVANFMTILILIPIFGFMLPMLIGIRTLRRAGRQAREQAERER